MKRIHSLFAKHKAILRHFVRIQIKSITMGKTEYAKIEYKSQVQAQSML